MPGPQRIPSLPGATQASKKAFKPPARVLSDSPSASSAPRTTTTRPSVANNGATTKVNQNPNRPISNASSANPGRNLPGFSRVDLEDIIMTSSDDDDDAMGTTTTSKSVTAGKPASRPRPAVEPPNKRKKLSRLPSGLTDSSPSSSPATPTKQPSPINLDDSNDNDDDISEQGRRTRNSEHNDVSNIGTDVDEIPLLPPALLTRLLHESFDDRNIKVSRDANSLMARYMDVFVREAVARAALVQNERKNHREPASDNNDDDLDNDIFLDTKDLEQVAPGLVLDF